MNEPADEPQPPLGGTNAEVAPDLPNPLPASPLPDLDIFGRPAPSDRGWAHRRGEPRVFAFFWTLYLLLATISAFWRVGAPGAHDPSALRPAARAVLAATAVGVALLWPMARLSQLRPSVRFRAVMRAVWQDMVVVLVPAQAVIWPQIAMAAWPVSVVGALAASICAWGLLGGALLTLALWTRRPARGWWMLAFVTIAGIGPLIALGPAGASPHSADFDWWWMTSPITSGFEISRDRPWTGSAAAVGPGHWRAIGAVFGVAAGLWAILGVLGLFRRPRSA
ncbi:MAG: hypothetical protein IPJ41_09615 [Phycisphaerales bacterium]|nr:hypothetical protein [Phycisphaerales bacterium]